MKHKPSTYVTIIWIIACFAASIYMVDFARKSIPALIASSIVWVENAILVTIAFGRCYRYWFRKDSNCLLNSGGK